MSEQEYWTVHTAGDSVAAIVQATDETDAISKGAKVYLAEFREERGYQPENFTTTNWWAEIEEDA